MALRGVEEGVEREAESRLIRRFLFIQLFQGRPDEDFLKNGWRDDGVFADPITETKVSRAPHPNLPSPPPIRPPARADADPSLART